MGTDYLDSVIVHYVCGSFPVEETVGALENLVREGKIRTYGLSNSQPADLAAYQEAGGNVSVVQEFFSILSPFHGREYFDLCKKYNTVFQTYGVLEEGFLTSPAFMEREFAKPISDPEYLGQIRRKKKDFAGLSKSGNHFVRNIIAVLQRW